MNIYQIDLYNIISDTINLSHENIHNNLTQEGCDSWDSVAMILLIDKIEHKFGISLSLDEIISIEKVQDILDLIEKNSFNATLKCE
jgi:acyl carrier protein